MACLGKPLMVFWLFTEDQKAEELTITVGDKYPNATITGIDLSPIQPTFVPENVHFFVDDFEEEWVDPDNKFDFIHLRHTLHSVQDPKALFRRALRYAPPFLLFPPSSLY